MSGNTAEKGPQLDQLFRPEDTEGLAALALMQSFAARCADPDVAAACDDVTRAVTGLAELLSLDISAQSLALLAGCALQRREIEQAQQ